MPQYNEGAHLDEAVVYVRVSSTGQLGRDGDRDGDGYSIPAQIKACESHAASLGATVVQAFVERAESARTDARPALQQMLRDLDQIKPRYLIVHKVDRLARNRLEDAQLYELLLSKGVTLVSASENIDETPAGRLMHGMLATFAEYYSNNLSSEIKKGLRQKHEFGGTPFMPPLGYLSVPTIGPKGKSSTVEIDPDRAPLVRLAFDLYATGNWAINALTEHLETQGLRTRETRKRSPAPLRKQSVHRLLRNPYYMGIVEYAGKRVVGRHEPLIDLETFDKVQAILLSRHKSSERPSKHDHYLKGSVFCATCGGRLLYGFHSGNGGRYAYFSCANRRSRRTGGTCDATHYAVDVVEREIENHYHSVHITQTIRDKIRADVLSDAEERRAIVDKEIERHRQAVARLKANQVHLVQLSYDELVSNEVLAEEQARLSAEQGQAQRALTQAQKQLGDITEALDETLARTETPHACYMASNGNQRRILNQAFFKRLEIGEEKQVVRVVLTPRYAAVALWGPKFGRPKATGPEADRRGEGVLVGASTAKPRPSLGGPGFALDEFGGDGGN